MANDITAPKIGNYTLIRHLGTGGMGAVFLAKADDDAQLIALKTLGRHGAQHSGRFRQGADAATRVVHSGVARTYTWGNDNGTYYIVSEYVDGKTVEEILSAIAISTNPESTMATMWQIESDDHPKSWELNAKTSSVAITGLEASEQQTMDKPPATVESLEYIKNNEHIKNCCKMARSFALALHHSHVTGVVHRDVKPANLMIDRNCQTKIIDFGVSRFRDDLFLSRTNAVIGTPQYMSPEHVTRDREIGPKSDIFSLGIVLYEALTLDVPHDATTPYGIMVEIATRPIKPIHWKREGIPADLQSIVHKATAFSPDQRYETAKALADDLGHYLEGEKVTARPYRYELDVREIYARRPYRILLAAVFYFFQALIFFLLIPGMLFAPQPGGLGTAARAMIVGIYAGCGLAFSVMGRALMTARTGAMILSPIVGAWAATLFIYTEWVAYFMGNNESFTLLIMGFLIVMNIFIVLSTLTPKSLAWFRMSRDLRSSYQEPSSFA